MPFLRTILFIALLTLCGLCSAVAQDLAPRAYVVTPVNTNVINLTYSYFSGPLNFNGAIPVQDARGSYSVPVVSYFHALNFFGRSANFVVGLPYGVGNFNGTLAGEQHDIYRSGLLDFSGRFSVNLIGGKAMHGQEFLKWQQKRLLGVSLKVIAPTGQYSPTKLINWGINRWAFKPEVGYSERWGHWVLDAYAGAWFYTENPASFHIPYPVPQTQAPVGSFEGHLSYDFSNVVGRKMRGWVSLDGNFWWGGIASVYGIPNPTTKQTSSRLGGTFSLPYTRHQSVKVSFSGGTYSRFGGDYKNFQVSWQYSWIGKHW